MGPEPLLQPAILPGAPALAQRQWGRLALLGAAVTVGLGTAIALAYYFLLSSGAMPNYDDSFDYSFGGGLFDVVKISLGVLALGLLVGAVLVGRRSFRSTARSPRRRLAMLVGVLPAYFFSGAAAFAADHALGWASDHSSEAHAARAGAETMLANYRSAPPKVSSFDPVAPTDLGARLLIVRDLGKGWYDQRTVNPVAPPIPADMTSQGVVSRAASNVAEQHWNGTAWSLDHGLLDSVLVFRSAPVAAQFARGLIHPSPIPGYVSKQSKLRLTKVRGVVVTTWTSTSNIATDFRAVFTRGAKVWTITVVTLSGKAPLADDEAQRIVKLAVARAIS